MLIFINFTSIFIKEKGYSGCGQHGRQSLVQTWDFHWCRHSEWTLGWNRPEKVQMYIHNTPQDVLTQWTWTYFTLTSVFIFYISEKGIKGRGDAVKILLSQTKMYAVSIDCVRYSFPKNTSIHSIKTDTWSWYTNKNIFTCRHHWKLPLCELSWPSKDFCLSVW